MVLILLLMLGVTAHAQNKEGNTEDNKILSTYSPKDHVVPGIAVIHVVVTKAQDPVFSPLTINISVLCLDKRLNPDGNKPHFESIATNWSACEYRKEEFDGKMMYINISQSPAVAGEAQCVDNPPIPIDLQSRCKNWQN